MTPRRVEELLVDARRRIDRVPPDDLASRHAAGALVVDIRPAAQRDEEGELGFGLVVERNVLEWRFDLLGDHALPQVQDYSQEVVVVCSEGYASSLAAASLRDLGFVRASDLAGGFRAWRAAQEPGTVPETSAVVRPLTGYTTATEAQPPFDGPLRTLRTGA